MIATSQHLTAHGNVTVSVTCSNCRCCCVRVIEGGTITGSYDGVYIEYILCNAQSSAASSTVDRRKLVKPPVPWWIKQKQQYNTRLRR